MCMNSRSLRLTEGGGQKSGRGFSSGKGKKRVSRNILGGKELRTNETTRGGSYSKHRGFKKGIEGSETKCIKPKSNNIKT